VRNLVIIAVGLGLAALESLIDQLLPLEHLTPDLVLPLVLYMGLAGVNAARGSAIAFVLGYFVDATQPGSPICLHMFLLVCLFLLSRLVTSRLLLAGTAFHVLLAFTGSLVASLIIVGLRAIFEQRVGGLESLALVASTRAAATAVATPLVFAVARRIEARRAPRREDFVLR
jgi:cell shape-determining protein MreD